MEFVLTMAETFDVSIHDDSIIFLGINIKWNCKYNFKRLCTLILIFIQNNWVKIKLFCSVSSQI